MKYLYKEIYKCIDCPYAKADGDKMELICDITKSVIEGVEVPSWCPLPDKMPAMAMITKIYNIVKRLNK